MATKKYEIKYTITLKGRSKIDPDGITVREKFIMQVFNSFISAFRGQFPNVDVEVEESRVTATKKIK